MVQNSAEGSFRQAEAHSLKVPPIAVHCSAPIISHSLNSAKKFPPALAQADATAELSFTGGVTSLTISRLPASTTTNNRNTITIRQYFTIFIFPFYAFWGYFTNKKAHPHKCVRAFKLTPITYIFDLFRSLLLHSKIRGQLKQMVATVLQSGL